jgi:uncharacterized protein (DUF1810 family)
VTRARDRLERFKRAQGQQSGGFDAALHEIRTGRKRGHWIWYVFPQLSGLGASSMSQTYAISGLDEAAEYLRDPELRSRLLTITSAVAEQLTENSQLRVDHLMGSSIDAQKLVSSLTLFGNVAQQRSAAEGLEAYGTLARLSQEVLAISASQGYPACEYTLTRLAERELG